MNILEIKTNTKIHNLYFAAIKKFKVGDRAVTAPIDLGKEILPEEIVEKWLDSLCDSDPEIMYK